MWLYWPSQKTSGTQNVLKQNDGGLNTWDSNDTFYRNNKNFRTNVHVASGLSDFGRHDFAVDSVLQSAFFQMVHLSMQIL